MLKCCIEYSYQIRVCHIGKTALSSFYFKTLLIQLKLSNQPQVKAKDFFCPLEVLKFVHAPQFYRAMRVYSAQFQDLI